MKFARYLSITIMIFVWSAVLGQADTSQTSGKYYPVRKLTIEPGIGINPYPTADVAFSNLVHWNIKKRLHVVSRTSLSFNNAFGRNINYVKTNYNNTFSQTFGVGTSLCTRRSSHSFSLMVGFKYDAFKETMENPDFEKVSASVSSVSPDVGLMYSYKVGKNKYFFSFRTYIPFYPYPFKGADINSIDGNLANLSMEFGVGIRLK